MSKDVSTAAKIILADTREPWPHPWERFLPEGWALERGTLETGDLALGLLPEGGVIERKTSSDLANCIGKGRERFERELRRGRYVGRMVVVVEGTLTDVAVAAPAFITTPSWARSPRGRAAIVHSFFAVPSDWRPISLSGSWPDNCAGSRA